MRAFWTYAPVAAVLVTFAAVHGCTINIFSPGDLEPPNQGLGGSSSTSSSGGGGSGGSICTCGPADSNPCTDDLAGACPNGDENACHPALATGMPCTDSGGKAGTCDAAGMCIGCSECADPGCLNRCVGQKCGTAGDCANGLCVDGYCCESACEGPCNACNRVPGSCQPLPVGITSDVAGECMNGQACDNTGTCITQQNVGLGALCNQNASCESGKCVGQICVSLNGQPCVEDLECGSRLCDPTTHKCMACTVNSDCPNNVTCTAGVCAAQLGQPATMTAECEPPGVIGSPDNLMCSLPQNSSCTNNFECASHDCNSGAPNGTCGKPCTVSAECASPTTCNPQKGYCFLPPGSYCVVNDQCQGPMGTVGKCTGFPRRCQ